MPKYGYLVVEGPHDVEFAYRVLSPYGLNRVQFETDLDRAMLPLIPRSFPHGGDLQKRVPVPLFIQSQTHCIAIHSASGDSRLAATVQENSTVIDFGTLTGIGIILDTDREIPAGERYAALRRELHNRGFTLPENPGDVSIGLPHLGAFVLPDNNSVGNLEDLLLECAEVIYPRILASAKSHVEVAKQDDLLRTGDGEDLTKTPIHNKAVVGAIASVLRPGKAIQTSIQDNRWLRGDNLKMKRVMAVQEFLVRIFDL